MIYSCLKKIKDLCLLGKRHKICACWKKDEGFMLVGKRHKILLIYTLYLLERTQQLWVLLRGGGGGSGRGDAASMSAEKRHRIYVCWKRCSIYSFPMSVMKSILKKKVPTRQGTL